MPRQRSVPHPRQPLPRAQTLPSGCGAASALVLAALSPGPASLWPVPAQNSGVGHLYPHFLTLLHRLQVAAPSPLGCCLVNSEEAQCAFLLPWVTFLSGPERPLSGLICLFPAVPELMMIGSSTSLHCSQFFPWGGQRTVVPKYHSRTSNSQRHRSQQAGAK